MSRRLRIQRKDGIPLESEIKELDFIDQIYYINLEHRTDRKEEILQEIKLIDPELKRTARINAIKHDYGEIGCGESHILAIKDAIENNHNMILILEDDFNFDAKISILEEVYQELIKHDSKFNLFQLSRNLKRGNKISNNLVEIIDSQTLSGYLIRNNNKSVEEEEISPKEDKIINSLREVSNSQTTSGYLVNNGFFQELIDNFTEAVEKMKSVLLNKKVSDKEKQKCRETYAIDQHWKKLQGPGKGFYTSNLRLGYQRPSYSDINKEMSNYLI